VLVQPCRLRLLMSSPENPGYTPGLKYVGEVLVQLCRLRPLMNP